MDLWEGREFKPEGATSQRPKQGTFQCAHGWQGFQARTEWLAGKE